jgi:hypothetical protein
LWDFATRKPYKPPENRISMRKVYGQSRIEKCPFCGAQALSTTKQGVPCCKDHTDRMLELKCVCGEWLEMKKSKWGPFFVCVNCGTVSFRKAMEMNEGSFQKEKPKPREMTVRSDELDFFS